MTLVQSIYSLYQDIGKRILPIAPGKLKVICEKHLQKEGEGFSVTLEIIVLDRINDEDYGIIFSTNAQQHSHFGLESLQFNEGLYVISDLSFGDGAIIAQTNEINYLPSDKENNQRIWNIIRKFSLSKFELMKTKLSDKYGIVLQNNQ